MLEAQLHEDNAFVTLTYADENLPRLAPGEALSTLEPRHLQLWLKRLRKAVSPSKVRFYAVGEYGDENFRPHYHAAIFGLPPCRYGQTRSHVGHARCCATCQLVGETWGFGNVYVGTLEVSSAQYVAGYVTKKMTRTDDPRLLGRWPEFCRMSLRPGIGHDFLHEVASSFLQFNLETSQGDVPVTLRHGSRELPLGRYLRMKLRRLIGRDEKTPAEVLAILAQEMRPLRESAFNASRPLKAAVLEASKGALDKFEARQRIFKTRRRL